MNVTLIISEYDHRRALDQASSQPSRDLGVLYSPLVEDEERLFDQLWRYIKDAILTSARSGYQAAREQIAKFEAKYSEAAEKLSGHIDALSAQLADRLNNYLRDVIKDALGRVEPQVSIGGAALSLKSLTVQQTFKLSSSLSISLATICAFVAEGQMAVSASYETK